MLANRTITFCSDLQNDKQDKMKGKVSSKSPFKVAQLKRVESNEMRKRSKSSNLVTANLPINKVKSLVVLRRKSFDTVTTKSGDLKTKRNNLRKTNEKNSIESKKKKSDSSSELKEAEKSVISIYPELQFENPPPRKPTIIEFQREDPDDPAKLKRKPTKEKTNLKLNCHKRTSKSPKPKKCKTIELVIDIKCDSVQNTPVSANTSVLSETNYTKVPSENVELKKRTISKYENEKKIFSENFSSNKQESNQVIEEAPIGQPCTQMNSYFIVILFAILVLYFLLNRTTSG